MIELIRKNGVLYAKAILDLRIPVNYKGKKYFKGEGLMLEVDEVYHLLMRNCNVRLYNGKEYIKLNYVQFHEIIIKANYKAIDYVEPKKEEPVVQPKVEEPVVIKEEPKQQPVQEPKKEQPKQQNENNNNKKQRHNNNNNKQQGGDK